MQDSRTTRRQFLSRTAAATAAVSVPYHFTASRFEGDAKVSNARMTVHQNGVLIHDDVAIPSGTGGGPRGPRDEVPKGPVYVQSHSNPVQYRNIWIVEK